MEVNLETAVRTLVIVAMGQDRSKRVIASLIVALLSRKFAEVPQDEIARLVTSTIIEEGGSVHKLPVSEEPVHVPAAVGTVPLSSVDLK